MTQQEMKLIAAFVLQGQAAAHEKVAAIFEVNGSNSLTRAVAANHKGLSLALKIEVERLREYPPAPTP